MCSVYLLCAGVLHLVLPGEADGDGGLQKSSPSDAVVSHTLSPQLGGDTSEDESPASPRWDDTGEMFPAPSATTLLSAREGNSKSI